MSVKKEGWVRFQGKGYAGIRSVTCPEPVAEHIIETLPALLRGTSGTEVRHALISTGRRAWIYTHSLCGPIFIKYYERNPYVLKALFRPERAFRHNRIFWQLGLPVPEPLVFLKRQKGGIFRPCIAVNGFMEGYQTLHTFCFENYRRHPVSEELRAHWIQKAVTVIAKFHQKGFSHGDLNPYNILVTTHSAGRELKICVTDFDYVKKRFGKPPHRFMIRDLATLAAMVHNVVAEPELCQGLEDYLDILQIPCGKRREQLRQTCRQTRDKLLVEFRSRFEHVAETLFLQAEHYLNHESKKK